VWHGTTRPFISGDIGETRPSGAAHTGEGMKRSKKQREALRRRIADWEAMPSVEGTPRDKRVRVDKGGTSNYHRPGSQNPHKGLGRRKKR
jgi:hypothetical protein